MTKIGIKYLSYITIFFILSQVIESITVKNEIAIIILGFVLLLVNLLIKPLLLLITLPLSMITFGLFSLIVNTWTIMLADFLVPDIKMGSFLNSFIAALLILFVNHVLISNKHRGQENV